MKKSIKAILASAAVLLIIAATALITYRYTMHHITVSVQGNMVNLTVYGQTDNYYVE